ncbi:hypothetical protein NQT62_02080 [Limnobacter humi]|uniref:Uncharacterized protein n=1 Tax=Limnobacter humi TaxID=1778671 RepID=A0ABT1WCJ3_9BURK|nr:hypothetical protein [Limnobacter humi]MCQ8895225.1 hypothetical protein [Limnobacter humi]
MKPLKWPLILLCLWAGISEAASPTADWNTFTAWLGKAPSTRLVGQKSLLRQPAIQAALKQILPKAEQAALARFKAEAPVAEVEGLLIVDQCLPHNCPADMATVVIDPANQTVWAGFFTRAENRVSTRWYGMTDDYSVLPEVIRKGFLERHGD